MTKILFILGFFISLNTFALPDDASVSYPVGNDWNYKKYADPQTTQKILDGLKSDAKPNEILSAQVHILMRKYYNIGTNEHLTTQILEELNADYHYELWLKSNPKNNDEKILSDIAVNRIKMNYKKVYTPKLASTNEFLPTIDLKNKTYTFLKKNYDKNDVVVTKPGVSNPSVSDGDCQWELTTLRRVLRGSGCSDKASQVCSGYVLCNKKGVQSRSLATCSASNCSNGKAMECVGEKGYGSRAPDTAATSQNKSGTQNGGTNQ